VSYLEVTEVMREEEEVTERKKSHRVKVAGSSREALDQKEGKDLVRV
jgi:hypothetical protein